MIATEVGPIRVVLLVGMMGVGKSSVGRATARLLSWPYIDNDDQVRELAGSAAPDVASRLGIEELHRLERAALDAVLEYPGPLVASAAGSIVDDVAWRGQRGQAVLVVWLRACPETLLARVGAGASRPSRQLPISSSTSTSEASTSVPRHWPRSSPGDVGADTRCVQAPPGERRIGEGSEREVGHMGSRGTPGRIGR